MLYRPQAKQPDRSHHQQRATRSAEGHAEKTIGPGSSMSGPEAVAIGIGSLIAGWFVYDFLCDSALGKRPALLGFILFLLLVAAAFGLSKVFSGRGAYLHVGAIIGTIMVGNVFRIIMPAQRALVAAIKEGRSPDPALPADRKSSCRERV